MDRLVSVIMPVYNVEKYVEEAVRSIQNQTYKNLEIIVIDDGSTDNTFHIVESLLIEDKRIKLYKNEENLRIVKTLNKAISLATGEFIVRMDGDDISLPSRIETLLKFLLSHPEYSLVGSAYEGINENGEYRGISTVPSSQFLINKVLLLSSPVSHIWIAKKNIYAVLGGYRADTVEDYDFLLRLHTMGYLFTNIPDVLYKVRLRDGNTASTQGLKQEKAYEYVVQLYKERFKFGYDSYSDGNFKLAIKSSQLAISTHIRSQEYLNTALSSNRWKKVIFTLYAVILSPYTFKYIYRRLKYKYIMRRYS